MATESRKTFNPEWMKGGLGKPQPGLKFSSTAALAAADEMAPAIFAKNRYGREDMLALFQRNAALEHEVMDRMGEFYIPDAMPPICVQAQTDIELRLLTSGGMNSNKIMNMANHEDKRRVYYPPSATLNGGHRGAGPPGMADGGGFHPRGPAPPPQPGNENRPPFYTQGYRGRGRGARFAGVSLDDGGAPGHIRPGHRPTSYHEDGPLPGSIADRPRFQGRRPPSESGGPPSESAWRTPHPSASTHADGSHGGSVDSERPPPPINPRAEALKSASDLADKRPWKRSTQSTSSIPGRHDSHGGRERTDSSGTGGGQMPEWLAEDISESDAGTFDASGKFQSFEESPCSPLPSHSPSPSPGSNQGETPPSQLTSAETSQRQSLDDQPCADSSNDVFRPAGRGGGRGQSADESRSLSGRPRDTSAPAQDPTGNGHGAGVVAHPQAIPERWDGGRTRADSDETFSTTRNLAESLVENLLTEEAQHQRSGAQQSRGHQLSEQQVRQMQNQRRLNCDRWYYQDNAGTIQGPFTRSQMLSWFNSGYFYGALMVRAGDEPQPFESLKSVMSQHENRCPFEGEPQVVPQTVPVPRGPTQHGGLRTRAPNGQQQLVYSQQVQVRPGQQTTSLVQMVSSAQQLPQDTKLSALEQVSTGPQSVWSQAEAISGQGEEKQVPGPTSHALVERQLLQRRLEEMQMQMKLQKEGAEQSRLKAEAERRENQRLEELARQQQAEQQERERREAALQAEQMRKLKEEQNRKAAEERVRAEAALAEQRRLQEELRKKQEEEERLRREAAERAAAEERRKVREAERQRNREEQERARAVKEEEMRKYAERMRIEAEKLKLMEQQKKAAVSAAHQNSWLNGTDMQDKKVPWTAQAQPLAPQQQPAHADGRMKTLAEIQEEEERQQRAEAKERAALAAVTTAAAVAGSNPLLRSPQKQTTGPAWGGAGLAVAEPPAGKGFWDDQPEPVKPSKPAKSGKKAASQPPAHAPQPKKNPKQQQANAKVQQPAWQLISNGPSDEFSRWCETEVKKMNSTLDADTFITYLLTLDSNKEVDEFIEGYLGTGREAKAFAANFHTKRVSLSAQSTKTKNMVISSKTGYEVSPSSTSSSNKGSERGDNAHQHRTAGKGKKKKMQRVVDTSVLGFTAVGDPNRVNVGEIDTV